MSDFTLPLRLTVIAGMPGSGKTTFAIRYLLNCQAACRFVFDDTGQAAARLHIRHASTPEELEADLATRWVVFNPHRMFPGDVSQGFRFFCHWAFLASRRAPGRKVFLADEIWRFCTPQAIPRELATLAQMGRSEDLELMVCTQVPHKLNSSITGSVTELVCFRLQGPLPLAAVQSMGGEPEEVEALPLGSFVSWAVLTGGRLEGRVF